MLGVSRIDIVQHNADAKAHALLHEVEVHHPYGEQDHSGQFTPETDSLCKRVR